MQRLQPAGLGLANLLGHLQPGVLAQHYYARIGNEEGKQADEPDPDALFQYRAVELRLVYLGQQVPVGAQHRTGGAEHRHVAIVPAKEDRFVLGVVSMAQVLGRQQLLAAGRQLQAEGRVRTIADVIDELDLLAVAAKQQGLAAAVRHRPGLENAVEGLAAADLQHDQGGACRRLPAGGR